VPVICGICACTIIAGGLVDDAAGDDPSNDASIGTPAHAKAAAKSNRTPADAGWDIICARYNSFRSASTAVRIPD
jgi:hypothetical protein